MHCLRYPTLWLLLLLLGGCTGLEPREPASADWQAHRHQLALLQHWTASGKLALRTADTSESVSLVWHQAGSDTDLQLSGPLGVGATIIRSDGQRLDIRRGDEHHILDISTPDAIALNTGWDLPLLALPHWLKGLPAPDLAIQELELDPQTELLQHLQQDGWVIRYEKYGRFEGIRLPTRMQISRGATRLKTVIAHWQTVSS